jgi:hypothetical protein
MNSSFGILLLCAISGVVIILGCFVLLWKRRIHLDREGKKVTSIELPLGIKMSTHGPVLVLMMIAAGLLIYSVSESKNVIQEVTANGSLSGSSARIDVYASVASAALPSSGTFSIPLPAVLPARKYMLLYTVNGSLLAYQYFDPATDGKNGLPALEITVPAEAKYTGEIQPQPQGY